jgi:muconate cycloisomerase
VRTGDNKLIVEQVAPSAWGRSGHKIASRLATKNRRCSLMSDYAGSMQVPSQCNESACNGIADLPIRFFEQPVDDRGAMMRLARSSPVALCADEHADALETIMSYSGSGLAGVSLKLVKLGGISGVMRGAAICRAAGMAINLAGKIAETSIAAAANLHCAAAINELRYGCSPGNQVISRDVTAEPLKVEDGSMLIPDGPGLGIEVDEDLVRSMAP